jgi:ketosteroid isomerase-like protein
MRPWILLVVFGVSIAAAVAAADRVEEIREAHLCWVDALNRRDVDYMQLHSLPEISMFNVGDALQRDFDDASWEAMRAQARQAATQDRRVSHEIEEIKVYGDVAVITGYATVTVGPGDAAQEMRRRITYVWVDEDGQWKQTHHHVSPLRQE